MPNLVKRYLCWDEDLVEKSENMQLLSHKPERKNIALRCDDPWEGIHNGYGGLVKVGDTVHISGRSDGSINVQLILERLGGGGRLSACRTFPGGYCGGTWQLLRCEQTV